MKSLNRHNVTYFIWAVLAKYKNCELSMSRIARMYPQTNWSTIASFPNRDALNIALFSLQQALIDGGWVQTEDTRCLSIIQKNKRIDLSFDVGPTCHKTFALTITPYAYTVKNTNL